MARLVVKMLLSPRKTADRTITPTTFTMPASTHVGTDKQELNDLYKA